MAQLGMDVEHIESIGNQLKQQAAQIGDVINHITNLITQTQSSWWGQDAQQFASWWNDQHRPHLQQAQEAINGLGQAALNNASDQRAASGH